MARPQAEEPPVGLLVTLPMFKWDGICGPIGSGFLGAIESAETVSGGGSIGECMYVWSVVSRTVSTKYGVLHTHSREEVGGSRDQREEFMRKVENCKWVSVVCMVNLQNSIQPGTPLF